LAFIYGGGSSWIEDDDATLVEGADVLGPAIAIMVICDSESWVMCIEGASAPTGICA
jgi:hypothetical protein